MKPLCSACKSIKVNVGCGWDIAPGYENIDNSPSLLIQQNLILRAIANIIERISGQRLYARFPKGVRRWDIIRGLPYEQETVEVVYSSHLLEHLHRQQVEPFLSEVHRVLVGGGILRLALPSLEGRVRKYLAQLERAREGGVDVVPADEFMRSTLLGSESWWSLRQPASIYRAVLARGRHLWMWDAPSLLAILRKIGFREVCERGFRESAIPEINFLELESHKDESFYVEARK